MSKLLIAIVFSTVSFVLIYINSKLPINVMTIPVKRTKPIFVLSLFIFVYYFHMLYINHGLYIGNI